MADVTFFVYDLVTSSQILKIQKPVDVTKYAKGMKGCRIEVSSHVLWKLDHLLQCSRAAHEVLSRDGRGTFPGAEKLVPKAGAATKHIAHVAWIFLIRFCGGIAMHAK